MEKRVLVTGATDGIGRQTALELARLGYQVVVHGRSPHRVEAVQREIHQQTGRKAEGVVADLSSLQAVRHLAAEISHRFPRLEVLLHNAGVFMHERQLTADQLETTFAVNHLAPFLLTTLLRPLLLASAPARVVTVSSIAHRRGQLDFEDLQGTRNFHGYQAYAASKLANVLFTRELAEQLADSRVTANCLHPGVIGTKLLQGGFGVGGASVEEGARTSVHLAHAPELETVSGRYFADLKEETPSAQALDRENQKRLWDVSARLAGL